MHEGTTSTIHFETDPGPPLPPVESLARAAHDQSYQMSRIADAINSLGWCVIFGSVVLAISSCTGGS